MSYQVEKVSSNQVRISFDVDAPVFEDAIQKAYLKMKNRINVPGFRKGKAPRRLIENIYGSNVFYEDALDIVFPDVYEEAIQNDHLEVVDRPEMDTLDQIEAGKNLQFSVKVYVSPDVELGDYKGLKAVKYTHKVTDEEIDGRIKTDVDKATTMEDVTDRPLENGDTANLDYAGTVDGVAFEGGTAAGQTLEIGSGSFIPGFEDKMIGMQVGEEKDLDLTFPEEYHAKDLAGKAAVFHVKLNGISKKVLPELNDDFAQDVSEFDTFEAYKQDIAKKLEETAEENSKTELENTLVQAATDASDCDIPAAMIDAEVDSMIREMKMRMMYSGLRFEDYLKYTGQTEDAMKEVYRSEATNRVKMQLVLKAISKAENIVPTDEEVDAVIEDEAKRMGREIEQFKAGLNPQQLSYLRENAVIRKVVDLIRDNASVEEKDESEKLSAQDAMKAAQDVVDAVDAAEEAEPKEEKPAKKRAAKKTAEEAPADAEAEKPARKPRAPKAKKEEPKE